MTPTEDRLREALDAWAATVPPSPEAYAEHRRRLRRDRNRRAGVLTAAAAVIAAAVVTLAPWQGGGNGAARPARPSPTAASPVPTATSVWTLAEHRPTSDVVPIPHSSGLLAGEHAAAYWSHAEFCIAWLDRADVPDRVQCLGGGNPSSSAAPVAGASGDDHLAVGAVRTDLALSVARADAVLTDGSIRPAYVLDGRGFVTALVAVPGVNAERVAKLRGYDAAGRPVSDGPVPLELRRVLATDPGHCRNHSLPRGILQLPSPDGESCLTVGPPAGTPQPAASASAARDPNDRQWLVAVELRPAARRAFFRLTRALAPAQGKVAIVACGQVLAAPYIQEPIPGGRLVIAPPSLDEQRAEQIAAALAP